MKQLLQNLRDGATEVAEVPAPRPGPGEVLIRTHRTLVSAGTERMLVEFGKASLIDKARQQPDKVREVIDKVRSDGLAATIEAVRAKLDQPIALGYSNLGTVIAVGEAVTAFSPGDRVASNGRHAEVVSVPANLCAKVPDAVSDEAGAFTVVGAIALEGVRLAKPTLGEAVVVTGLGLVGLLTVQLLRAHGARVLGLDFDEQRLALARSFGAETFALSNGADPLAAAEAFSRGRGVDAVLVTAATASNEPVRQAARMCRKRGRIVLVGVAGLELSRADFYEKELSFQVSCSYGPGRYDPAYEQKGQDYPVGFVRWTAQRNFEAVLDMMADARLNVTPLISHRFALEQAEDAFSLLTSDTPSLGIVLAYAPDLAVAETRTVPLSPAPAPGKASVAFLGAGNYASRTLIPAFQAAGARLMTLVSASGASAVHVGRKYGFAAASADAAAAMQDAAVDTVVVATRHNAHARQVLAALRAGKHVFCEKPLCLTLEELAEIESEARTRPGQLLMVGFNRRFAPLTQKAARLLKQVGGAKSFVMTVNAGAVPPQHWTRDPEIGGGRIVGEACHFIDLLRFLADAPIASWRASPAGDDGALLTLCFADGSLGAVHYLTNGHKGFPKERLEVFAGGRILQLDNFRALRGWGWPGLSGAAGMRQDKGQRACAQAFVEAVRTGAQSPIPLAQILEVSRVSIEAQTAARR